MRYSSCLFIGVIFLWSCHARPSSTQDTNSSNAVPHPIQLKPLPKGVVIDSVACLDDPSQVYAIYLPTKYDTAKKWPIIYFFDPHGVGNLPVLLYKDLAEKYGFILAGTYNSKNGMPWENTEKVAKEFMKDTRMRLSIDDKRLYTFGFSGGAMVASMVAMSEGGIAGVVACGGSMPGAEASIRQPFAYISFVGNKDFHYVPARQLDNLLDSISLPHQLIFFDGKHQWPPVPYIEQAFLWLDANAMRAKTMPKDESLIKSIQDKFVTEAQNWHKKGNTIQEYYTYKKLINFLQGIDNDVNVYAVKCRQLKNTAAMKKYLQDEEAMDMDEMQQMDDFRGHLSQMDPDWWNGKIAGMKKIIQKDSSSPEALQAERLLGYLSLAMYMGADGEFKEHNYPAASYFVELYALVDPQNPEHSYLSACLAMTNHNTGKALQMLQDAVKLGFSDSKRLEKDSNFVTLHNAPPYKKLLVEMAAKPQTPDMTK